MAKESTTNTEPGESEAPGISSLIRTVESYIKDPKLVTKQTLEDLRDDLLDIQGILEPEEEGSDHGTSHDGKEGGILITIAKARRMK